jgi:predicted nucleotidyltransferase
MTDILLDLSGKLPDALVEIFRRVARATAAVGFARWFVVGAQARDLLLRYGYNLQSGRATNDVDFAVAVESWDEYNALREALITAEGFTAHPTQPQRLVLANSIIDTVPFGPLETIPVA